MDNTGKPIKSSAQLAELYDTLDERAQQSLSDFADFLAATTEPVVREVPPPEEIPRPDDETVVGAIKRLKMSYHMIDNMAVFSKASSLMTEHMMNGRDAMDVIDEMEAIFDQAYREMLGEDVGDETSGDAE